MWLAQWASRKVPRFFQMKIVSDVRIHPSLAWFYMSITRHYLKRIVLGFEEFCVIPFLLVVVRFCPVGPMKQWYIPYHMFWGRQWAVFLITNGLESHMVIGSGQMSTSDHVIMQSQNMKISIMDIGSVSRMLVQSSWYCGDIRRDGLGVWNDFL